MADMLVYVGLRPTSDIKQHEIFGRVPVNAVCPLAKEVVPTLEIVLGNLKSPSREVFSNFPQNSLMHPVLALPLEVDKAHDSVGEPEALWTNVWKVKVQDQPNDLDPGTEQPDVNINADTSIFTQKSDAFMKAHVDPVVAAIHIGNDLSLEEVTIVQNLIKEYANCFTLSMSKVHHIPGAVHKINVPKDKVFNMKVHQQPLTPLQHTYFNGILD